MAHSQSGLPTWRPSPPTLTPRKNIIATSAFRRNTGRFSSGTASNSMNDIPGIRERAGPSDHSLGVYIGPRPMTWAGMTRALGALKSIGFRRELALRFTQLPGIHIELSRCGTKVARSTYAAPKAHIIPAQGNGGPQRQAFVVGADVEPKLVRSTNPTAQPYSPAQTESATSSP